MKARKYTEEQTIAVLREGEAGARVADLCRKYGMSDATYYNWKAKYAGMTSPPIISILTAPSTKSASQILPEGLDFNQL